MATAHPDTELCAMETAGLSSERRPADQKFVARGTHNHKYSGPERKRDIRFSTYRWIAAPATLPSFAATPSSAFAERHQTHRYS